MDDFDDEATPSWLLPDKVYDLLKWLGLVVCPAAATLTLCIGNALGATAESATAATIITGVGTFIGAIIGVSALKGGGSNDNQ